MKIEVIQGFDSYEPGQVFADWPAGMCELLIARGLIKEVVEVVGVVDKSTSLETQVHPVSLVVSLT